MANRTITLPKLQQWQKDVYDAMENAKHSGNIYVVKAKRQIGKSVLASVLIIKSALESKTTNAIIEPTLNQSRRVFKQITQMLEGSNTIKNANASLLTIDFVNGSELNFKSAEQKDNLRGMTVSGLLVIDEGAFVTDDVYEIVYPWVDVHKAPILIISTPLFADGQFYKMFVSENTISFDWSTYDTSVFLSNEKLEMYRKEMTPLKFTTEYLGQFATDGSYVFQDINDALYDGDFNIIYNNINLAIDWASGNDGDYTWLSWIDEDGIVVKVDYFNNIQPSEQIERIASQINQYKPKKVTVETNSIGSVYLDFLKRKVNIPTQIIPFTTTNESKRRIIEQLSTAFQQHKIRIPRDAELIKQLQHYCVEKTKNGYTYNGIGAHDDGVMSLAMGYDLITNASGTYSISLKRKAKRYPDLHTKRGLD